MRHLFFALYSPVAHSNTFDGVPINSGIFRNPSIEMLSMHHKPKSVSTQMVAVAIKVKENSRFSKNED